MNEREFRFNSIPFSAFWEFIKVQSEDCNILLTSYNPETQEAYVKLRAKSLGTKVVSY